jgi:putative transposase
MQLPAGYSRLSNHEEHKILQKFYMMQPGNFYHLYNHANGTENLFMEERNYYFFLQLMTKHILATSKLFAYALMPNHFHLLIQLKIEEELMRQFESQIKSKKMPHGFNNPSFNIQDFLIKKANQPYSNFLNSYTQSFNKVYHRKGSLFMQNMKQKEITNDNSFCKVVHYLHANPVHHRFVKSPGAWPHTSYKIFLSNMPTSLERNYVLDIFGGLELFIKYHEQPIDPKYKSLE